jgi:hypothetical protein
MTTWSWAYIRWASGFDLKTGCDNKLEKGKTVPKLAPQQEKWHIHHKKEGRANIDEKIEYARSVFLNARRPHIKNDIGYKSGDKHNSRVNSNDKEFIMFMNGNSYQDKK